MTTEEIVRYVVARAVWAPSVHNTQPWRFTADDGPRLSLYADADRRLAVADPDGREMMISCWAALFTIRLALRSLGYIPETRVLPDPGQALQRILLTASMCGAAVALHSQPLELPRLREFLRTQLGDGACPHLVLRIGLVTQVAVSVRRDPADVQFPAGPAS